jgi:hypothetical protein
MYSGMLRRVALVAITNNRSCVIVFLRRMFRILVTANVVPSSPILVTLIMEAIFTSETSFIPESYGVTSQKTAVFIVIAIKISNLTRLEVWFRTANVIQAKYKQNILRRFFSRQ